MRARQIAEELMAASTAYAEAVLNSGDDDAETLIALTRADEREQMTLAALSETRATSRDEIVLKTATFGRLRAAELWPRLTDALLHSIGLDAAALARAV